MKAYYRKLLIHPVPRLMFQIHSGHHRDRTGHAYQERLCNRLLLCLLAVMLVHHTSVAGQEWHLHTARP